MNEPANERASGLSRLEGAGVLAVAIGVFLLLGGPIWSHRWDPDASIVYSYVPIPMLVFVLLLARGRFGLRMFLLETLRLTVLKFGITAGLLIALWTVQDPPAPGHVLDPLARRTPTAAPLRTATPTPAPAVSAIPPHALGEIAGDVRDGSERPVAGAIVYVASGLERFVFEPGPDATVTFGSGRVDPVRLLLRAGTAVVLRSGDGRLHTAHAFRERGDALFNVPLLPSGDGRRVPIVAEGAGGLRCEVHPEEAARLLVVRGGFLATTGPDGRFRLRGVPAGRVRLAALDAGLEREVDVVAGATVDGSLRPAPTPVP